MKKEHSTPVHSAISRADINHLREQLISERDRVRTLIAEAGLSGGSDRESEDLRGGGQDDTAGSLTSELTNDAILASLRDRLGALDAADIRIVEGTYGRSLRSGRPIPLGRLEADPAATLTVEEANETTSAS